MFKLATRLVQAARSSKLDEDSLRHYVSSLRKKYEDEVLSLEEWHYDVFVIVKMLTKIKHVTDRFVSCGSIAEYIWFWIKWINI